MQLRDFSAREEINKIKTHEKRKMDIERKGKIVLPTTEETWKAIEYEFDVKKIEFGKKINFVKDPFKRMVIFRDIEQAFVLASLGFSKPAVVLAGGVIEELLRLYLDQRGISPQKPLRFKIRT